MHTYLTQEFPTLESLRDHGDYIASSFIATRAVPTREAFQVMDAFAKRAVDAGLEVQVAYEEFLEHLAFLNEGFDEEEEQHLILASPTFRSFQASFEFADALTYLRPH